MGSSQPEESLNLLINREDKVLIMNPGKSLIPTDPEGGSILDMYKHRDVLLDFEIDLTQTLANNASRLYKEFLVKVKH